jgi:hypothetical protein
MILRNLTLSVLSLALLAACSSAAGSPGADRNASGTSITPASAAPATATVRRGDIYETLRLTGTIERYEAVAIPATVSGLYHSYLPLGKQVSVTRGRALGRIDVCSASGSTAVPGTSAGVGENTVAPSAGAIGSGATSPGGSSDCHPATSVTVRAPVGGRLIPPSPGQVTAGTPLAEVQPSGLHIRLPVEDPSDRYHFVSPPRRGRAQIVGGPAGFIVRFERTAHSPASDEVTVYTTLPTQVRAFPGLRAVVVFVTAVHDDVLVLPESAVRGRSQQGQVVSVDTNGRHEVVAVRLGAADGENIEVRGLDLGAAVLQYPLESDFG